MAKYLRKRKVRQRPGKSSQHNCVLVMPKGRVRGTVANCTRKTGEVETGCLQEAVGNCRKKCASVPAFPFVALNHRYPRRKESTNAFRNGRHVQTVSWYVPRTLKHIKSNRCMLGFARKGRSSKYGSNPLVFLEFWIPCQP